MDLQRTTPPAETNQQVAPVAAGRRVSRRATLVGTLIALLVVRVSGGWPGA